MSEELLSPTALVTILGGIGALLTAAGGVAWKGLRELLSHLRQASQDAAAERQTLEARRAVESDRIIAAIERQTERLLVAIETSARETRHDLNTIYAAIRPALPRDPIPLELLPAGRDDSRGGRT